MGAGSAPRAGASGRRPGCGAGGGGRRTRSRGLPGAGPDPRRRPLPAWGREDAARARPTDRPTDRDQRAAPPPGSEFSPRPGTRKNGGADGRSPSSSSRKGSGGGHTVGPGGGGGIRRLTCSSRGSRYRSMRRQHGASACSRSSRAEREGLGREQTWPWPWGRETGGAWAVEETEGEGGERGAARERARGGWARPDGRLRARRAPDRLERESARGRLPPPPDVSAPAREREARRRLPGTARWGRRSVGNCSPVLSGSQPGLRVLRTHPGRGGSGRRRRWSWGRGTGFAGLSDN